MGLGRGKENIRKTIPEKDYLRKRDLSIIRTDRLTYLPITI